MKPIVIALLATACSQHVYSPPTQAFALEPIAALPDGRQAVDLELSRSAQVFDPAIDAGALRLRSGVGNNTELSVEGTSFTVQDTGPSTANRTFYAGRAGVRINPDRGALSFTGGVGGGYSAAGGTFAAVDAGAAIGYQNCVLVPSAQISGYASAPMGDARPVDVSTNSDDPPVYSTPQRTLGVELRAGLRLALDRDTCRHGQPTTWLSAGAGTTTMVDATTHGTLMTLGLGLSVPL